MQDVADHFEGDQLWMQLMKASPEQKGQAASVDTTPDSLSPSELQHLLQLFEGRPLERCGARRLAFLALSLSPAGPPTPTD